MTDDPSGGFTFADEEEARSYLRELRFLWTSWIVALALLVFVEEFWLFVVVAVVAIGSVLWFARPLQRRADRMSQQDATGKAALPTATLQDRTLKALAYGEEPLRAATVLVGGRRRWLIGRHVMLAVTAAALLWVLVNTL